MSYGQVPVVNFCTSIHEAQLLESLAGVAWVNFGYDWRLPTFASGEEESEGESVRKLALPALRAQNRSEYLRKGGEEEVVTLRLS